MPRRRRNTRLLSRQTGHPYGTNVETGEPVEVIIIEDGEVPPPPPPPSPPPTPLIVIDDDDDDTVPAEVPVETLAEEPVEAAPAEAPAEEAAEDPVVSTETTPGENLVEECVICQEGGTLVDSNCHECHVKVHQNCLDNWLYPRLNEPTCPHCRTVMVLSGLDVNGIRQRKRAGMTEAVSNTLDKFFIFNFIRFYTHTLFSFDCYRCLASIVITCVPYVGGPGFTGTPLT